MDNVTLSESTREMLWDAYLTPCGHYEDAYFYTRFCALPAHNDSIPHTF